MGHTEDVTYIRTERWCTVEPRRTERWRPTNISFSIIMHNHAGRDKAEESEGVVIVTQARMGMHHASTGSSLSIPCLLDPRLDVVAVYQAANKCFRWNRRREGTTASAEGYQGRCIQMPRVGTEGSGGSNFSYGESLP